MCGLLRDGDVAVERRGIRKTNGPVVDGWILGGQVYVYTCVYIHACFHKANEYRRAETCTYTCMSVCLHVCM